MKIIKAQIQILALAVLLLGGLGLHGCSTGTKDGDANVEKGGPKDKNPTEHNVSGQQQPSTDTTGNMDKPYDRAEKASDKDADGMADTLGTKSEHTDPQKH